MFKDFIARLLTQLFLAHKPTWKGVALIGSLIFALITGLAYAIGNPGYLNENVSDVPAGGGSHTYRFWYTTNCDGDPDCDCDTANDVDTSDPPDGTLDEDSPNDCIAVTDSDMDGIFDTGPDADSDGLLNLVDPDWMGGGAGVVESVPRNSQRSINRYVNDWGMKEPKWDTDTNRNIYIYNIDAYGYANTNGEELDTAWMLTQAPEPRGSVLHEAWHNTQYAYGASAGAWFMEGQARMMQDKVFDDLDNRSGSRYHNSVNIYLGNTTYVVKEDRDDDGTDEFSQAKGLLGASYNASLWWTYLADQAGTLFTGTAGEGVDLLKAVLEQADDHGRQGVDGVNRVLLDRLGQGFDDTFWDFTVANYAKDFDLTLLNHDYLGGRDPEQVLKYSDEDRVGPDLLIYDPVERTSFNQAELIAGQSGHVDGFDSEVDDPDAMSAYGANYYEAAINPDCVLAYWRVDGDPDSRFMHSWMLLQEDTNSDGVEEVVSLLRSEGQNFARAAWNLRSDAAPSYSRMVGIVATEDKPYGYDWEIGCVQPGINMISPTTANPAYVGDPNEPGRFLLWVEVTGGAVVDYIAGLEWDRDFSVTVGGDAAEILNGGYVQNQYWLVVQAPDKPGATLGDKFPVTLQLGPGGVTGDSETDAVIYEVRASDQVLVVDRSGSMADNNKLPSAKTAARLFSDVTQKFDQLGVVSFSVDATEEFPLTPVPDQDDAAGVRGNAQTAIDGISLGTTTSIGDGLQKGQDLLDASGKAEHLWAMVLLSDGMENESLYWNDVRANILAAGTQVHAIALGQDADEELMREIAESTCGSVWVDQCYHYIEESGVVAALSGSNVPQSTTAASDLPNGLADVYRRSQEAIAGQQRLWQDSGNLAGVQSIPLVIGEDGVRDAFFSFNWNDPAAPLNSISISGGGVSFTELSDGQNHRTFYAPKLPPGSYTIQLTASSGTSQWIGSLSGRMVHGTEMHAFLDNVLIERRPGLPVHLQVALMDHMGPLPGAMVVAQVRRPDGTSEEIQLVDDGGVYDDIAGDGVYGYVYDRINRPLVIDILEGHTWRFDLHASGLNNDGNPFDRYQQLTYTPFLGREQVSLDQDKDGMLDRWENRFDGVDGTTPDGDLDTDGDGLSNKEEFELGTNPDDPDTDRGGEVDGSEVKKGQNPLLTADDSLPGLTDFWVENLPGRVVLHFNPRPEYLGMRVYRRTGLGGSFSLIGEFDPTGGEVSDSGLVNNQDYFYYLQPVGASGFLGAPSTVLYAEPAVDPFPPEAVVVINDDDYSTNNINVTLKIQGLSGGALEATHMQVSNSPDLAGVPWKPFQDEFAWTLDPDPVTDAAFVYVRLRDAAGNVSSIIYGDGILYKPPVVLPFPGIYDFDWLELILPDLPGYSLIFTPLPHPSFIYTDTLSTSELAAGPGQLAYAGISFQLEAMDSNQQPVNQFDKPFTLQVHYQDWQWQTGGVSTEDSLNLYSNSGLGWQPLLPCQGCSHNTAENVITVQLNHLTEFALFGKLAVLPEQPKNIYLPFIEQ